MGSVAQAQSKQFALSLQRFSRQDHDRLQPNEVLTLSFLPLDWRPAAANLQRVLGLLWTKDTGTAPPPSRRLWSAAPRAEVEEARASLQPFFSLIHIATTDAVKVCTLSVDTSG